MLSHLFARTPKLQARVIFLHLKSLLQVFVTVTESVLTHGFTERSGCRNSNKLSAEEEHLAKGDSVLGAGSSVSVVLLV